MFINSRTGRRSSPTKDMQKWSLSCTRCLSIQQIIKTFLKQDVLQVSVPNNKSQKNIYRLLINTFSVCVCVGGSNSEVGGFTHQTMSLRVFSVDDLLTEEPKKMVQMLVLLRFCWWHMICKL